MRTEANGARPIFQEIKALNDQLHDKSVKKSKLVLFEEDGKLVDLPTALDAVGDANRSVTMRLHRYEKASGFAFTMAMCLGGSVPVLNGVALKSIAPVNKGVPINDVAELQRAWEDTQLY